MAGQRQSAGRWVRKRGRTIFRSRDRLRQTEVQHLHFAFGRDPDVRRFQIPMNDSFAVRGLERFGDLLRIIERGLHPQRAVKRFALHQLQHEAIHIAGFFDAVNRGNVRMIQRSERARLAAKPRQPLGVPRELVRQNLDGNIASQLVIVRAVHLSHSAGAQTRHDAMRSELPTGTKPIGCEDGVHDGSLEETAGFLFLCEQDFDLASHLRVRTANPLEKRGARFQRTVECRVEDLFSSSPIRIHASVSERGSNILLPGPCRAINYR